MLSNVVLYWYYNKISDQYLTLNMLWANSADDKLIIHLFFPENKIRNFMQIDSLFPENRIRHFMQIVS